MMYISGADIVANKPMLLFDLVLFFSIHCYLCKKACIKTANDLNANDTSILFIMSVMRFSCLHAHNICAKLFVSSMNIALVKCLLKYCSKYTTTTYLQMVNSHWYRYQQTHTFNIQGSNYSILDVHSPLSKHNVGCSNGSEITALTEVVTLEIDVCTTNA